MPPVSEKYAKKKFNDIALSLTNDEAIIYELNKHVESFNLKNMHTKRYFDNTDLSMDAKTKIWMNGILPDFYPHYHCHDCYEFNLIFEGKCIEIINGSAVTLEKGDILILPSNTVFHTHFLKSGGRGCNILVKSTHITKLRDETKEIKDNFLDKLLKKNGFCIIHTEKHHGILKDADKLLDIFMEENKTQATSTPPSALSRMYVENTFYRMILMIFKGMENGEILYEFSATVPKTPSSEEIITYIKENHATVSASELSKKFGYSQRQLNRIIKKYTGSSFSALIICERILHAKNLLKNTSLSINEISKAIGLDSKTYFCNMFKAQTTMTPNEYRKMARNIGSKN